MNHGAAGRSPQLLARDGPNRHHAWVPIIHINTAEGIRIPTELAGVGSRFAAVLLDLVLLFAAYICLLLVIALGKYMLAEAGVEFLTGLSNFALGLSLGGLLLVTPLYFILFQIRWSGQTPGKRAVGIRTTSRDGAPATPVQHLLRGLLWPVDVILWVPVPIGLILIATTHRCLRLGDMAAGTLVLSEQTAASYEEPWPSETWSEREGKQLDLSVGMGAKLDRIDVRLLRDAICRRDIPVTLRKQLYRKLIKHYSGTLGFEPVKSNEASLKELYLFARESRNA
ncbi:MAG: putative RDD family membrane protein YckC [Candidatus Paceibacteria bacterium]|jgi:uncharacterized RDD family membrane protein YckC